MSKLEPIIKVIRAINDAKARYDTVNKFISDQIPSDFRSHPFEAMDAALETTIMEYLDAVTGGNASYFFYEGRGYLTFPDGNHYVWNAGDIDQFCDTLLQMEADGNL